MKVNSKLELVQDKFMLEAFKAHGYNKKRTAKFLCCGLRTVQRNLKKLGIPEAKAGIHFSETEKAELAQCVERVLESLPVVYIPSIKE